MKTITTVKQKFGALFIFKTHDLPGDDIEISDNLNIHYCNHQNCNYFEFIED